MDISFNSTKDKYISNIDKLFDPKAGYIDQSTRVHFITFSLYQPISDYFVSVEIMVEFFISGVVHPTYISIMPFKGNVFELSGERALQICDIFRMILCLFIAYNLYLKLRFFRP